MRRKKEWGIDYSKQWREVKGREGGEGEEEGGKSDRRRKFVVRPSLVLRPFFSFFRPPRPPPLSLIARGMIYSGSGGVGGDVPPKKTEGRTDADASLFSCRPINGPFLCAPTTSLPPSFKVSSAFGFGSPAAAAAPI